MLTDEAGAAVWGAVYDPFGMATVNEDLDGDSNAVALSVRFPGQYYDVESGLHYNYFRYYDPNTGRYITSDPIGLHGGLNTYGYVEGNPLYWIDPLGLQNLRGFGPSIPTRGTVRISTEYGDLHNALQNAHDPSSVEVTWATPSPEFPVTTIIELNNKADLEKRRARIRLDNIQDFTDSGLSCMAPISTVPTISR